MSAQLLVCLYNSQSKKNHTNGSKDEQKYNPNNTKPLITIPATNNIVRTIPSRPFYK